MVIRLSGHDLPGAQCHPAPDHPEPYDNVHVGIGRRDAPSHLVRGDATAAEWHVDVRAIEEPDGSIDFRGGLVQGKRGDRFLYLNWGTVDDEGGFHLFRRAKVMLSAIDPDLVRAAIARGAELHASFGLTNAKGLPTTARLKPPLVQWEVEPAAGRAQC